MGLLDDLDNILLAIHLKQNKYKYDFITEYGFNNKLKCMMRSYSILKYHIEVIEHKRYKIRDTAKRGKLIEIIEYLRKDLDFYNRTSKKEVDSTWVKATS